MSFKGDTESSRIQNLPLLSGKYVRTSENCETCSINLVDIFFTYENLEFCEAEIREWRLTEDQNIKIFTWESGSCDRSL